MAMVMAIAMAGWMVGVMTDIDMEIHPPMPYCSSSFSGSFTYFNNVNNNKNDGDENNKNINNNNNNYSNENAVPEAELGRERVDEAQKLNDGFWRDG